MKVIPTLLTTATDTFSSQYNSLKKYYTRFQIDIADNTLVPNTTLQVEDLSPFLTSDTQCDFHLMVTDYERHIKKLATLADKIHIGVIFLHASISPNYKLLTTHFPHLSFGLVFDLPDNPTTILLKYKAHSIKHFQIMTIVSGFQGSSFNKEALNKIEQVRYASYKSEIYIDGGVNDKTIPLILQHTEKPDFLCIGSYLVKAEDLEKRVEELTKLVNERG